LLLPLELSFASKTAAATQIQVSILHLISYEGMGTVRMRCGPPCSCAEQTIDAHSTSAVRNVSIFVEHTFSAVLHVSQSCPLAVLLTNQTSSGGFKFKIRGVTARAG